MVSIRRRRLIAASAVKKIVSKHRKKTNSQSHHTREGTGTSSKKVSPDCSEASSLSEAPAVKRKQYQRRKSNKDLSNLRGVYYKNMKWQAAIKVGKKQVHLGTVACKEDAAHLYDRAAYMCGREPNFQLEEEVRRELDGLQWEDFLELTRKEIANKKMQKRLEALNRKNQAALCKFSEIPD